MHNYKKLIAIPLASIALFASCSKTLNAEGAKKFVASQYEKTQVKTFSGVSVIASIKPDTSDEAKAAANETLKDFAKDLGVTYKEDSYAIRESAAKNSEVYLGFEELCKDKIASADIDEYEKIKTEKGIDATVTYTTNSGELGIYSNFKSKAPVMYNEETSKNNANELDIYNNVGQLRYTKFYGDSTNNGHKLSFSFIFEITFAK